MTEKKVTVTQADALKFLEGATRNWRKMPKLSAEDVEDVADALHWFAQHRTRSVGEGEPVACTCLSELAYDAYGPGGPMSGKQMPPSCLVHAPKTTDSVDAVREGEPVGQVRVEANGEWILKGWATNLPEGVHWLYTRSEAFPKTTDAGEAVREALANLERACDRLAGSRSQQTYLHMIDHDKATDLLAELDEARALARSALQTQPAGEGL